MVKHRSNRNKLLPCIVLGSLAPSVISAAANDSQEETQSFRRKRVQAQNQDRAMSSQARKLLGQDALADMWESAVEATATARLLEDFSVSLPTRNPTDRPTPPPSEPTPPTERPTSSPTVIVPTAEPTIPQPTISPAPTAAPSETCLEGTPIDSYLLSVLGEVTDSSLLLDPSTPQGMAFDFMVNDDPLHPCDSPTLEQRYGLLTLYYSTSGSTWTDKTGWLSGQGECEWFGIQCNDEERVTRVTLAINNLNGVLPDEMSTLFENQQLDLFANNIRGGFPAGLSNQTKLAFIDVSENQLDEETFPESLLSLTSLEIFRASGNSMGGEIPANIGVLSGLKQLWTESNSLQGTLPTELGTLRFLDSLYLGENEIVGSIPSELGRLPLSELRLQGNNLQETIPAELFNVGSLKVIRLEKNFLFGPLPATIGQLTNLEDLRLEENNLSGQIPADIRFLSNLENLVLRENFWSGTVPNVFQNFEKLDFFDISNNLVGGNLPSSVFNVPTLRIAYFSNCTFTGEIPSNYVNPPLLKDLYLDGNQLTGTVPSVPAGNLLQLNEFLLHRTRLTGTMPASVCDLVSDASLDDLWADCGGARPEIECEFGTCCNRCFEGGAARR